MAVCRLCISAQRHPHAGIQSCVEDGAGNFFLFLGLCHSTPQRHKRRWFIARKILSILLSQPPVLLSNTHQTLLCLNSSGSSVLVDTITITIAVSRASTVHLSEGHEKLHWKNLWAAHLCGKVNLFGDRSARHGPRKW